MKPVLATVLTAAACLGSAGAPAQTAAPESARTVMKAQAPNVVTVRITAKVRISASDMGTMDMDMAVEATGLLLDPRGLVVCSLNATDPQKFYEEFLEDEESDDQYSMSTEVTNVTVMFEGGASVEATPGLRDTDLDLAYFTLKKAGSAGTVVRAAKSAPQAFDELVALRRLGDVSGRVCAGTLLPIQAVVERPRKFYIVSNDVTIGLGEPVFDLNGDCIGVVTVRKIKAGSSPTYFLFSGEDPYSAVIVLPIADVLEGARQHEGFDKLGTSD